VLCEGLEEHLKPRASRSSDPERIGHPIDVVEPRRDERDLKDRPVIEAYGAQAVVMRRRDARRILGYLHYVVEHRTFGVADGRRYVVLPQRLDERFIESDPTQKLCV
jgi:hypothetical protein